MTVPYTNQSFMGAGDLFVSRYDADGVLGSRIQVGNADDFVINAPDVDKAERKGKMRANYGTPIHSQVKGTEQGLSFTLTDFNRHNLAIAMFGTDSTITQSAGNDASAVDVTADLDAWVALAKKKLDPDTPPVVQDDSDTDTYVEGTDYEIDYQAGMIMALSDGDISDDDVLHVVSTWLAYTGFKVTANTSTQVNCKLELYTQNKAGADTEGLLTVHKAQIEPSGDMGWLSEDYIDLALSGTIITVDDGSWDFQQF